MEDSVLPTFDSRAQDFLSLAAFGPSRSRPGFVGVCTLCPFVGESAALPAAVGHSSEALWTLAAFRQ